MIVVDASALVEVLLQLDGAGPLMDRMFAEAETLHAPELLDIEVAQVVRRYWHSGDITAARGAAAIADLGDFPITRYPHTPLLDRVWQLRSNATAYDAVYLALAEGLGATLLTRDRALADLPGVRATVEVI